jgi:CheY-like chemotaxis protein
MEHSHPLDDFMAGKMAGIQHRILVVDDQAIIRDTVSLGLRQPRRHILTATDGAAALALLETSGEPVDLVLTDIDMPVMDGFTLIRSLLNLNYTRKIGIMSGGFFTPEWREQLDSLPVCFSLQKPFSLNLLKLAVERTLHLDRPPLPASLRPQRRKETGTPLSDLYFLP